jgi:hypothetical protein
VFEPSLVKTCSKVFNPLGFFRSFYSQRTFKMADILSDHKDELTPTGLSFFQAAWDETVTNTYTEMLGKDSIRV